MSHFMLGRKVLEPAAYAERSCVLVKYRLPLLPHCFVLCHEPSSVNPDPSPAELMAFFLSEAGRLAHESVGDPQAFMLIHSGSSIRKRSNWHMHVFVVQHRWQKAWAYSMLGIKNALLALYYAVSKASVRHKQASHPSIERPHSGLRPPQSAHVKR